MVRKAAVAAPGPPRDTAGYERAADGDVTVWWRQSLVLKNGEPYVTNRVWPRRVSLDVAAGDYVVAADYR